jgi:hypothetical protein
MPTQWVYLVAQVIAGATASVLFLIRQMTSHRTVFSYSGDMMTSKQPTARTADAGIAAPSHEYSHNIGPDGPVLLRDRCLTAQKWLTFLDTTARAELGRDQDERGWPWSALMSILLWFTLSAVVTVLPYVFGSGVAALSLALASACVALFAVGAAIGRINSQGAMLSGTRLLLIGGGAALLVFVLEHLGRRQYGRIAGRSPIWQVMGDLDSTESGRRSG